MATVIDVVWWQWKGKHPVQAEAQIDTSNPILNNSGNSSSSSNGSGTSNSNSNSNNDII